MTIRELAKIANISPAAVSLVLNNKPGVSDATRRHVTEIIQQYDYHPKRSANLPEKKIVRLIKYTSHGMLVEENQGFVAAITDKIQAEFKRHNIDIIMMPATAYDFKDTLSLISESKCDGVIILGTELSYTQMQQVSSLTIPAVVVDNAMPGMNIDSVVMQNEDIVFRAVQYLYSQGHRNIGYLQSRVESTNFLQRKKGYYDTLKQLNLSAPEPFLLTPTLGGAYSDMKQLLEKGVTIPEAVFADNDTIAIGAMKAMQEYGIKVPEQVSVIGVDDIAYSAITQPSLTTMRISRSQMGVMAVYLLLKRMGNPERISSRFSVAGTLMERDSTTRK